MFRRKAAFKKHRQHQWSVIGIICVVLMLCAVVGFSCRSINQRLENYKQKEQVLKEQIAYEQDRAVEIEEYRKYTKTKKFAEEVAKDKLGLVYEGEIIFREEK